MATKDQKIITKDGLQKLKDEYKTRTTEVRKDIADKLDEAKSAGDLSENSAYHAALEEYQFNETRINELKELITNLKVAPSRSGDSIIDIGDEIKVKDVEKDKAMKYTIVGEGEGDPKTGRVSTNSVLGSALVGKRAGDRIIVDLPSGRKEYEIIDVK